MKPFHFKQFTIQQSKNVFKVGTDGLLLGAWTKVEKANSLLDVGTGTGIVALMCAQRNPQMKIVAIDINNEAVELARLNFENSPWRKNAEVKLASITDTLEVRKFDVIVCNPPYFINSSPTEKKYLHKARHQVEFRIEELFEVAAKNLHNKGTLNLIYPSHQLSEIFELSRRFNFHVQRHTTVFSKKDKMPERELLSFGFEKVEVLRDSLVIQHEKRNDFTEEYKKMTGDYHTIF